MAKQNTTRTVTTLKHDESTRVNIPSAEYQSVMQKEEQNPVRVAYERRNRDLDPQLVWRGLKHEWAERIGAHMDIKRNSSPSFQKFVSGLRTLAQR